MVRFWSNWSRQMSLSCQVICLVQFWVFICRTVLKPWRYKSKINCLMAVLSVNCSPGIPPESKVQSRMQNNKIWFLYRLLCCLVKLNTINVSFQARSSMRSKIILVYYSRSAFWVDAKYLFSINISGLTEYRNAIWFHVKVKFFLFVLEKHLLSAKWFSQMI